MYGITSVLTLHLRHKQLVWHMIWYSHDDDCSNVNASSVWLSPRRRSGCSSCRWELGRSILADGTWGFGSTSWRRSGEPRRGRLEGPTAPVDWWSFASRRWTSICAQGRKTSPDWHSYQSARAPTVLRKTLITVLPSRTVTVLKELPYHWNTIDKINIYRRAQWRAAKTKTIKILQPFLRWIKQWRKWMSYKKKTIKNDSRLCFRANQKGKKLLMFNSFRRKEGGMDPSKYRSP